MLKILFNSIYKLIRIIYQFLFSGVTSDNIDFFLLLNTLISIIMIINKYLL